MPLSQNMSMSELSRFRTRICERKALHGVCELDERCPFSHCLSWHRRNPYEYAYRPNLCPNVVFQNENKKMRVKNYCQRGRMCMFSHTKEEQMYHVLVYKTQLCREYPLCTKHYCPFAHGLDELRDPEKISFDPVQGPEVIERQRLIHDNNKFSDKTGGSDKQGESETDLRENETDVGVITSEDSKQELFISSGDSCNLNKSPARNVDIDAIGDNVGAKCSPRINNKYNMSPKTSVSTSLGSSPRRTTSRTSSSQYQKNSAANCQTAVTQSSGQPSGELTPVNTCCDNNQPLTPSTGCETPLNSKTRQANSNKGVDSRKISGPYRSSVGSTSNQQPINSNIAVNVNPPLAAQCTREHTNTARNEPGGISAGSGAYPVMAGDSGGDFLHARDCVNIPPPPYSAIGLNFQHRDSADLPEPSTSSSCGLSLPNYDFGKLSWIGNFEDGQRRFASGDELMNRTRTPGTEGTPEMDDYGDGNGVEQMSYLMHLQLLSLSDPTRAGKDDAVGPSHTSTGWNNLACPSFTLDNVCCGRQTICGGSCCVGPETQAANGMGNGGANGKNSSSGAPEHTGTCMQQPQFYFPSSGAIRGFASDFIGDCNKVICASTAGEAGVNSVVSEGVGVIGFGSSISPGDYGCLVGGNGEENSTPWNMFHPTLLNASNAGIMDGNVSPGVFWNEEKWGNITTNNY